MELSVIIVNYNVKYFLEQCLYSVCKACEKIEAEIFVVDNHSTDGSKEYFAGRFPFVHFRWKNINRGFGRANNSVLPEIKGNHILFLNPDTIVAEDCFEKCIAFFKENNDCGALGVYMMDGSGKFLKESKRGFPSPLTSFYKMTGLTFLFPHSRVFSKYYAGHLSRSEDHEVDVLAGAFMMVSKPALEKVKGFDEDYFMYGEDIDLSYRVRQAGLNNYYFSGTRIIHFKGESTQKNSYLYVNSFYGAMNVFIQKHYQNTRGTYLLMKAAISLSKLLAVTGVFIRNIFSPPANDSKATSLAVIADQPIFDQTIHLVRHSLKPIIIKGRIAIDEHDPGSFISKIDQVEKIIKSYHLDQLLFCEGKINFKRIIEITGQLSGKLNFLFHANNSRSIVGSNHKNRKGIFITEQ